MESSAPRIDVASVVVAAKAHDVYRAFSDPRALVAWLPPEDMTGRVLEYDFREGGRYRIELTYAGDEPAGVGKTTGRTDVSTGRFLALEPGKRIVQSVEFESAEVSFAGEMRMTWSFEALPAGTLVTLTVENVPRGITKADHDAGLRSSLENLSRFLASNPAPLDLIPDAIRIFVDDATAAQAFYRDTLGLPLQAGSPELGYLLFDFAHLRLIVETADPNDDDGRDLIGRIVGLSFRVGNIQEAYRDLQSRGVHFTGHPERQDWGGTLAHFRDPADNVLSLVEHPTD